MRYKFPPAKSAAWFNFVEQLVEQHEGDIQRLWIRLGFVNDPQAGRPYLAPSSVTWFSLPSSIPSRSSFPSTPSSPPPSIPSSQASSSLSSSVSSSGTSSASSSMESSSPSGSLSSSGTSSTSSSIMSSSPSDSISSSGASSQYSSSPSGCTGKFCTYTYSAASNQWSITDITGSCAVGTPLSSCNCPYPFYVCTAGTYGCLSPGFDGEIRVLNCVDTLPSFSSSSVASSQTSSQPSSSPGSPSSSASSDQSQAPSSSSSQSSVAPDSSSSAASSAQSSSGASSVASSPASSQSSSNSEGQSSASSNSSTASGGSGSSGSALPCNFYDCTWTWNGASWTGPTNILCASGCRCTSSPTDGGTFVGQTATTPCTDGCGNCMYTWLAGSSSWALEIAGCAPFSNCGCVYPSRDGAYDGENLIIDCAF